MIRKEEILERAGVLSLEPSVVEKDYVLGWLLHAIGCHPELAEQWIFKGGTCLKKVHFETYRFSEDLDFTLLDRSHLQPEFLKRVFSEISALLYEQMGLEIPTERLRFDLRADPLGHPAIEGRIYYRGPLQLPLSAIPKIKLDLVADERLVEVPERRSVSHEYSDRPEQGMTVRSYGYVEIFAEKTRALGDRGRSRDLYDVIHLFRRPEARERAADVLHVLREKCAFKGLAVPTFASIQGMRDAIAAQWEAMLGHQLPELPPFDAFWESLAEFFSWLSSPAPVAFPQAFMLAPGETVLRPATGAGLQGLGPRPLQAIRFAAANHLCVDLTYQGSVRRIEAYSLRRTRAGDVVLHAHRSDTGEHRSYRVDRIQGAVVTTQPFVPRWAIELSPGGSEQIPSAVARWSSASPGRLVGLSYVYECGLCGKRFRRKVRTPRLDAHKNKNGHPCPSRSALLVDTIY